MEYTVETIRTKNAIIRMHRPILTEEERAKRMKAIHDAACKLVIANAQLEEERKRNSRK